MEVIVSLSGMFDFKCTIFYVHLFSGHNGLVAAGYLQRSGINVCVLERRAVVGGAAVTEEIVPTFKFSRASYVLSLLRPRIYNDLELKVRFFYIICNPVKYLKFLSTFFFFLSRSLD